jgi:hypothetical protein
VKTAEKFTLIAEIARFVYVVKGFGQKRVGKERDFQPVYNT